MARQQDEETGRIVSEYTPEMDDRARRMAQLGATQVEIGQILGLTARTIRNWRAKHPSFAAAMDVGNAVSDQRVVRSLYERAVGYEYIEEQAIKVRSKEGGEEVKIVEVVKRIPPETLAGIYWTKNRMPNDWKDRKESHHSGNVKVEHENADEARATIARFLEREKQKARDEGTTH